MRDNVDIVHVLMNVEITVMFFMEGVHNFLKQFIMEGARLILIFQDKGNSYFCVNQAVFLFSRISLTFSITSIHYNAKTTASSIPAWSPTAVLTGPFHA